MPSLSTRTPNLFVRILILCVICLGLSACVGSDDSSLSDSTSIADTNYKVTVFVDGKALTVNVQVSAAMADYYLNTNDRELDKGAIEELVGDRISRAVKEGMMELPASADEEMSLIIDHEEFPGDPRVLHTEACVSYLGASSTSYYIVVNDGLGCRKYLFTDWYDNFYNSCTGATTKTYVKTTQSSAAPC